MAEKAKNGRRYRRATIERALAKALARCREIAADPTCVREVGTLVVFGSALDAKRQDYGDLDLALETPPKPEWHMSRHGTFAPALAEHAKHYPLYDPGSFAAASLVWAPEMVGVRRMKARSPVISIHFLPEFETLGCAYEVVYKRPNPGGDCGRGS